MKIEVHLQGGLRKIIDITPGATIGATIGKDVFNADGTLFVPTQSGGTSQLSITSWELILNIPANVTALANTATTGLYVITGAGTSATRSIQAAPGETTVSNGDGVAGNPAVGLADVADTGSGSLRGITRDSKGRINGTTDATITGTAGQVDVANGDAATGLPTISLADVADAGGGTFKLLTRDAKGRLSGTSDGDTDDVPEGAANLYFTDARARAAVIAATIVDGDTTHSPSGDAVFDALALKAPLASPAFTGNPTAPTPTAGDNDTSVATTAFVTSAISTAGGGYVPTSRTISTTAPLTGGGNLTADRTLGISAATTSAAGSMSAADKTKLDGIATGATVGANWNTNLSDIPANITAWASISPASKADDSAVVHIAGTENITGAKTVLNQDFSVNRDNTNTASVGPSINLRRARIGPGAVMMNDVLGSVFFAGHDGSAYQPQALFRGFASENWTTTARGTEFRIETTDIGSTSRATRWTISAPGHLIPQTNNTKDLGSSSSRLREIFCVNGTINTSDEREKSSIRELTQQELACAADLACLARMYQWNNALELKGDEARLHCSPTVQSVIACMESHGLDPFRYGFVCYDKWDEQEEGWNEWPAQEEVRDEEGNVIQPAIEAGRELVQEYRPAGDLYSLRSSELQFFIARGQEERLRRLEAMLNQ